MSGLPDACVDLIVADPPYNLGKDYGNNLDAKEWHENALFTKTWLAQAVRILKPTGSIYTFMGVRFISRLFLILWTTHSKMAVSIGGP
ncbi:MAG: DNA methyltransferase [Aggregatilineales bacterium]